MSDIGDKLRSARKAKGMSIEDIEKITKIQRRYLTAIENDDFDQLPGDFYVRAFIKQYAQVVGLDGKELLNDYHSEVPEAKPEEYVEKSNDNRTEEVRRTTQNKKGLWKAYLPKAAAVIGVFLVIFVIYLVYAHFFTGGSNQQAANQADNVTVSSSSEPKSKKKKVTKATSTISLTKIGDNRYRVRKFKSSKNKDLKVSTGADATWVQVTVDGSVKWQGTLNANTDHTLKLSSDVKNVSVQFGNTRSTKLSLAGKSVKARDTENPSRALTISFVFGSSSAASSSSSTVTAQSSSTYSAQSSTYTGNTQSNTTTTQRSQTTQQNTQNNNQYRQSQTTGQQGGQTTNQGQTTNNSQASTNESAGQNQNNGGQSQE